MNANQWRTIRAWLYGVSVAALPILTYYGVIEPEAQALAVPLLAALFNLTPAEVEAKDGELG